MLPRFYARAALVLTAATVLAVHPHGVAARTTLVVTSSADSGPGSLRQAILDANASAGSDTIEFALGGGAPRIDVGLGGSGPLPAITGPLTIDGGTGGATRVELDGAAAGAGANGLTVSAAPVVLRRLMVNRFAGAGVLVTASGRLTLEGSIVGADAGGTLDRGNGAGVALESSGSVVGGTGEAARNTIAFNDKGVVVRPGSPAPTGNAVRGNLIYENGIAIDLGDDGVTPNDPGDGDQGPNTLLNTPIIDEVVSLGPAADVHGSYSGAPNKTVVLDFYSSPSCGADASGGGRTVLGSAPVSTDASGLTIFFVTFAGNVPEGHFVTAVATDPQGNTSEFSPCVAAGADLDTAAVYVGSSGVWFLANDNAPGPADMAFGYGPGGAGWTALKGDWDGNGSDTPGLYDPATGTFFLRNANAPGAADLVFGYGPGGQGWLPVVGDWDGDGDDTAGLYEPVSGFFFLKNANTPGPADLVFGFGPGGAGWKPVTGDWDGDGDDAVGLYAPASGFFFLRHTNAPGPADVVFAFGPGGQTWRPLAGDFNHDGFDSVGLYDPASGVFFLRYVNAAGAADLTFQYGPVGAAIQPLVGDWNGS